MLRIAIAPKVAKCRFLGKTAKTRAEVRYLYDGFDMLGLPNAKPEVS